MKKYFVFILLFISSFSIASEVTYDQIDLKLEVHKLCRLVDRLEPGSYHFMSCKRHAQEIINKGQDLVRDTYKICSKGMVSEPHRCYSTLSLMLFKPLLQLKPMSFDERVQVESFILKHLFEERSTSIPRAASSTEMRIYLSIQETFDIVQGGQQTIMDAIILSCSRVSDWNMLLNPQVNDEWFELQNNCFESGFDWLEKTLIK